MRGEEDEERMTGENKEGMRRRDRRRRLDLEQTHVTKLTWVMSGTDGGLFTFDSRQHRVPISSNGGEHEQLGGRSSERR